MKIFLLTIFLSSSFVSADIYQDLNKQSTLGNCRIWTKSWTVEELKDVESLISRFSDESLKQVWYGNLILYSLLLMVLEISLLWSLPHSKAKYSKVKR